TGEKVTEQTSIGCHTSLWNFRKNEYHRWVRQEKIHHLLPGIKPLKYTFKTEHESKEFTTDIGIHDSSATLAPDKFALDNPFILVSTGTWSITLNPFNTEPLTFEELKRDWLCYMDIYGKQVKASRLFLGDENAHQVKKLNHYFGVGSERISVEIDQELLRHCIVNADSNSMLLHDTANRSGPFPRI